jgi:Sulfatase-modifying factor enzyme 1
VSVDKGDTVVGFYSGNIKATHKVERFKISKHPINNDQYKKCLAAGVCKAPKLSECSDQELAKAAFDGTGETAAVCVGYENAKAFCQWIGGRLPTLPEWLRAARGAEIQRYPWGAMQGNCKQHPRIDYEQLRYIDGKNREGCFASTVDALVARRHADGASRSGMEDILIAPAELVVGESNNTFGACGEGRPGSIDSVASYNVTQAGIRTGDETQEPELTPKTYAFRCVVEK